MYFKLLKTLILISIFLFPTQTFSKIPHFLQDPSNGTIKLIEISPCGISLASFLKQDKIRIEIYYGISWNRQKLDRATLMGGFVELDFEYSIHDFNSILLQENRRHEYVTPISDTTAILQTYVNQINHTLPMGNYSVALKVKNSLTKTTSHKQYKINISQESLNHLRLSDIEFSSKIELNTGSILDTAFVKGDLLVIPYPFSTINKERPVYFYFEIDNLQFDKWLNTSYLIEYRIFRTHMGFWDKFNPFRKENSVIASNYKQMGLERSTQEYFSMDFNKLKSGDYQLTIQVTDEIAESQKRSRVQFILLE